MSLVGDWSDFLLRFAVGDKGIKPPKQQTVFTQPGVVSTVVNRLVSGCKGLVVRDSLIISISRANPSQLME